jgi:transcriptional regulator of aromatic amino acid metabolism
MVGGLSTGIKTGTGIANAQYNAASYRQAAQSQMEEGRIQGWLIEKQYAAEFKDMVSKQERIASMNRVMASKGGITGNSADAVLQSYAAKDQRNLERLYYNAAMQTANVSIQTGNKVNALYEKARQWDWNATNQLIGGIVGTGKMLLGIGRNSLRPDENKNTESVIQVWDDGR